MRMITMKIILYSQDDIRFYQVFKNNKNIFLMIEYIFNLFLLFITGIMALGVMYLYYLALRHDYRNNY